MTVIEFYLIVLAQNHKFSDIITITPFMAYHNIYMLEVFKLKIVRVVLNINYSED